MNELYQQVDKLISDELINSANQGKLGDESLRGLHQIHNIIKQICILIEKISCSDTKTLSRDNNQINNRRREVLLKLKKQINTMNKDDFVWLNNTYYVIKRLDILIQDIINLNKNFNEDKLDF